MTGRRRLPLAELYVLVCTGLAALLALGVLEPPALGLLFLLLPAAIVPAAVLAVLQVGMFRTMARNWHRSDTEMRLAPVSTTPDTGV